MCVHTWLSLEELDLWAGEGVVPEPAGSVCRTRQQQTCLSVHRQVPDGVRVALQHSAMDLRVCVCVCVLTNDSCMRALFSSGVMQMLVQDRTELTVSVIGVNIAGRDLPDADVGVSTATEADVSTLPHGHTQHTTSAGDGRGGGEKEGREAVNTAPTKSGVIPVSAHSPEYTYKSHILCNQ